MKTDALSLCTEALIALRFGREDDAILALNRTIQLLAEEQWNQKRKAVPTIMIIKEESNPTMMDRIKQALGR